MKKSMFPAVSIMALSIGMLACSQSDTSQPNNNVVSQDVIKISTGLVKGTTVNGITSFKGIPYAAAPVGNLRWAATQSAQTWDGVFNANTYGADCIQLPFPSDAAPLGTEPDEDCLFLNIWTKNSNDTQLKPVVVWIHGGGFVNGGSSPDVYSGEKFAEKDVIFVSFNYRLGRFGFFGHPALTALALLIKAYSDMEPSLKTTITA